MSACKPIIRPATRADIEAFSGLEEKPSLKAWVMELDGQILAMGGVAYAGGRWLAFLDLVDEARPFRMTLGRAAIRFFAEMRKSGVKFIYAEHDDSEPKSYRLLQRLGFDMQNKTRFYKWSA